MENTTSGAENIELNLIFRDANVRAEFMTFALTKYDLTQDDGSFVVSPKNTNLILVADTVKTLDGIHPKMAQISGAVMNGNTFSVRNREFSISSREVKSNLKCMPSVLFPAPDILTPYLQKIDGTVQFQKSKELLEVPMQVIYTNGFSLYQLFAASHSKAVAKRYGMHICITNLPPPLFPLLDATILCQQFQIPMSNGPAPLTSQLPDYSEITQKVSGTTNKLHSLFASFNMEVPQHIAKKTQKVGISNNIFHLATGILPVLLARKKISIDQSVAVEVEIRSDQLSQDKPIQVIAECFFSELAGMGISTSFLALGNCFSPTITMVFTKKSDEPLSRLAPHLMCEAMNQCYSDKANLLKSMLNQVIYRKKNVMFPVAKIYSVDESQVVEREFTVHSQRLPGSPGQTGDAVEDVYVSSSSKGYVTRTTMFDDGSAGIEQTDLSVGSKSLSPATTSSTSSQPRKAQLFEETKSFPKANLSETKLRLRPPVSSQQLDGTEGNSEAFSSSSSTDSSHVSNLLDEED